MDGEKTKPDFKDATIFFFYLLLFVVLFVFLDWCSWSEWLDLNVRHINTGCKCDQVRIVS